MLLHIDGEVVEIRPSEFFESKTLVDSRYLELIEAPKKKGRPTKNPKPKAIIEEKYGNTSSST
jgi:hypothetical protein